MPDIMTHYFFGLDTTQNIKQLPLYKTIKDHRNVFFVGLCGPDPMYYHHLLSKGNYSYIASLVHAENTAASIFIILILSTHKY